MAILIPNIDKPISCKAGCPCFDDEIMRCNLNVRNFSECPIIEVPDEHGRLIDADTMEKDIIEQAALVGAIFESDNDIEAITKSVTEEQIAHVKRQPTVIEGRNANGSTDT